MDVTTALAEYSTYGEIFGKQVYTKDVWSEQTGCEYDEYSKYVECCNDRLYPFNVWFEHTYGTTYPAGAEWDSVKGHRHKIAA